MPIEAYRRRGSNGEASHSVTRGLGNSRADSDSEFTGNERPVHPPASLTIFEVITDREEKQRKALWPTYLAATAASKKPQFLRARPRVGGVQVRAPAR